MWDDPEFLQGLDEFIERQEALERETIMNEIAMSEEDEYDNGK
jgi:hypothetical protein